MYICVCVYIYMHIWYMSIICNYMCACGNMIIFYVCSVMLVSVVIQSTPYQVEKLPILRLAEEEMDLYLLYFMERSNMLLSRLLFLFAFLDTWVLMYYKSTTAMVHWPNGLSLLFWQFSYSYDCCVRNKIKPFRFKIKCLLMGS